MMHCANEKRNVNFRSQALKSQKQRRQVHHEKVADVVEKGTCPPVQIRIWLRWRLCNSKLPWRCHWLKKKMMTSPESCPWRSIDPLKSSSKTSYSTLSKFMKKVPRNMAVLKLYLRAPSTLNWVSTFFHLRTCQWENRKFRIWVKECHSSRTMKDTLPWNSWRKLDYSTRSTEIK